MIVVDTSGILALKDESHPEHGSVGELIAGSDDDLLLSPFVLAESDHLLAPGSARAPLASFWTR